MHLVQLSAGYQVNVRFIRLCLDQDSLSQTHKAIDYRQCQTIAIESDELISLDLDGEYEQGRNLRFSIQAGLLHLLTNKD